MEIVYKSGTLQAAIDSLNDGDTLILPSGVFAEKIEVHQKNITLIGDKDGHTVITWRDGAKEILEDGIKRGTFRSYTIHIDGDGFKASYITFANTAGCGEIAGQAVAAYVDSDGAAFDHCRFIGQQDTLFTAPLPMKEVEPGGFRGPGEFTERKLTTQRYDKCYIEGNVDFIFGGATAYFTDCDIFVRQPDCNPSCAYIAAPSTFPEVETGYVFENCRITSDFKENNVYLGRPWRQGAKTIYKHCTMPTQLNPEVWNDWGKPEGTYFFSVEE